MRINKSAFAQNQYRDTIQLIDFENQELLVELEQSHDFIFLERIVNDQDNNEFDLFNELS